MTVTATSLDADRRPKKIEHDHTLMFETMKVNKIVLEISKFLFFSIKRWKYLIYSFLKIQSQDKWIIIRIQHDKNESENRVKAIN